ncbi:hypothetical protein SDC9_156285 [bioreactor metagenome]|uniref:Uncharacterized protein n=1 Tax=bioreactor metagenome TaxID=1076179 RepID=A0A645F4A1_9ZZZZ
MPDSGTKGFDAPPDRFSRMIGIRQYNDAPLPAGFLNPPDRFARDAKPVDRDHLCLNGLFYGSHIVPAFHHNDFFDHILLPFPKSPIYYSGFFPAHTKNRSRLSSGQTIAILTGSLSLLTGSDEK